MSFWVKGDKRLTCVGYSDRIRLYLGDLEGEKVHNFWTKMATVTAPEASTACKKLRQGPARSSPVFVECPPPLTVLGPPLCVQRGSQWANSWGKCDWKVSLFGFILSID